MRTERGVFSCYCLIMFNKVDNDKGFSELTKRIIINSIDWQNRKKDSSSQKVCHFRQGHSEQTRKRVQETLKQWKTNEGENVTVIDEFKIIFSIRFKLRHHSWPYVPEWTIIILVNYKANVSLKQCCFLFSYWWAHWIMCVRYYYQLVT